VTESDTASTMTLTPAGTGRDARVRADRGGSVGSLFDPASLFRAIAGGVVAAARAVPSRELSRRTGLALVAVLLAGGCAGAGDGDGARGGGEDDLAGEWSPPLTLVEAGGDVPTTAVDPERGVAYVAWTGGTGEEANVHLVRIRPDGGISEPVRVNDVPGDAAPHGQAPATVAVGPEGNVYLAWQSSYAVEGRRFPASDLRFARSTDGGRSFEPAITVHADSEVPASHTFHDLRVTPDGTVVASWIDSRRKDAWLARHGGQGAAEGGGSEDGSGGQGGTGTPPGLEIRVARSEDGGRSFGPSTVVDSVPCPCCRTALAVHGNEVTVAWRKLFGEARDVRDVVLARSGDGGESFGTPLRVAADEWSFPACPHAGPALTVDDAGVTHVAWYTGKEGGTGLYYARTGAPGVTARVGEPLPLVTGSSLVPSQVSLAVGPGGLWLAWEERGRERSGFRLLHAAEGRRPVPDRAAFQPGRSPSLSVADDLRVVAWLEEESVRARIGDRGTESGGS